MRTLRTCEIYRDASLSIIGIESIESQHSCTDRSCLFYGKVEPVGIIVQSEGAIQTFDMAAKPMEIEPLRQVFPELFS